MIGLVALAALIFFIVYYVTNMDFEVGSGISDIKDKAKDVEYEEKESISGKIENEQKEKGSS